MAARTRSRFDELQARPKSDAYTGLLALSLIAMVVSCVILYLDYNQYGSSTPPTPNVPPVTRPGGPLNQGQPAATSGLQPPADMAIIPAEPLTPAPASRTIIPVGATEGPALPPG